MCGRIEYVVTTREKLEDHYEATFIEGFALKGEINARYNIAPTSHTPIVTSESSDVISIGHWGYVPPWTKDSATAKEVINARAETVQEKPYFRSSIITRRCLIPVTGFVEWKREGTKKTPFRFFTDNSIFSLAGVYTSTKDKNGEVLPHYAIITTTANEVMKPVHDRMPVIIASHDEKHWLDESLNDIEIQELMRPYPATLLNKYQISSLVNNPRNNSPKVIEPV